MKKVLIISLLIGLIFIVGCTDNDINLVQDEKPNFDDCKKDLVCYEDSFWEWKDLNQKTGNFSCGLIISTADYQTFSRMDGEQGVDDRINYCDFDEHIKVVNKENNITEYVLLKILYVYEDDSNVTHGGYNENNYKIASCFMDDLFNEEYDNTTKSEILGNCEKKLDLIPKEI